jgi:hypothetical protein
MKKSEIKVIPSYYVDYVNKAGDDDLMGMLATGGISLYQEYLGQLRAIGTRVYAPGKWSIPQIIEHVTDAERIFQYRALRFARQDKTPLPSFDENMYAAVSKANYRHVDDLLDEWQTVRESTFKLYKNFDKDQLHFTGTANNQEISVLALGFIIIGHSVHHFNVIREKYFGLIP